MASVSNFITLRAAIADTVNRDDLSSDVTAFEGTTIDSMIKRAVDKSTIRIQRDIASRGGNKNMEVVTTSLVFAPGVEYLDFPADFVGHRSFIITSNPIAVLEFVDPTTLRTQYPDAITAKPQKFTIVGKRRAYARPVADTAYTTELIYYQAIPTLSADADTNWIIDEHWDLYESAAMFELSIALENDERLQFWKGNYDQRMDDLMGDDRNVRWAAVPTKPNLQVAIA